MPKYVELKVNRTKPVNVKNPNQTYGLVFAVQQTYKLTNIYF